MEGEDGGTLHVWAPVGHGARKSAIPAISVVMNGLWSPKISESRKFGRHERVMESEIELTPRFQSP
ncbi:hypothetical protein HUG15_04420 [Salicibibacter cibarius]|uniref:Uncharacterized protein n=1 Tax=Salicibibacter cibarius TaxID=2743000 RepID=A0A7T6Z253_9BACI|nr:hypothetical protein [Salicibibacter cibarius]QQK74921.1 hypothetical protein HUG15_04420 [Salicibibacter cibarius]